MSQPRDIENELIAITKQLLAESSEPYQRSVKLEANLGLDSLARAELFRRIEKSFQVELPDRLLANAETLRDISDYLQHAPENVSFKKSFILQPKQREDAIFQPQNVATLTATLMLYAEKNPQQAHIFFQNEDGREEVITYGQLYAKSLEVAAGLKNLNLTPGETVAIMQPTSPNFFYTFFGTLLAGGIPVPIYPPFRMHMLEVYTKTEARILSNAEVRILITFDQAERLSHMIKSFVPSLKYVTTAKALQRGERLAAPFVAEKTDAAFIQYTSGSTSDPKGVLLTHENLLSNIKAYGKAIEVTPEDITVSWLPLYHDMGLIGMWLGSMYFGIPLVLLTPFSFLNHPEKWLWAIHYHRGTLSGAPNFAYELCIRKIDPVMLEGLDLSSWRVAANGAEKIYPRTLNQFAKKFKPYGFNENALLPVYGLAESTVALLIPKKGEHYHIDQINRQQFENNSVAIPATGKDSLQFVSCGVPIEGHEVRIVDAHDQPLPDRHVGALQFRGPSSMQGYYRNEAATAAVMHQGFIASGDYAYQVNGEFYITGRMKDLIIKAGRNLYPAEIEEIVSHVDGVRQGCVVAFGINDTERGTEQLIVVAEVKAKKKKNRRKIVQHIQEAIDQSLDIMPDHIVVVAPHSVPKTSSGKLQRAACKQLYLQGKLGRNAPPTWMQITRLAAESSLKTVNYFFQLVIKTIFTTYVLLIALITCIPLYFIMLLADDRSARRALKGWCKMIMAFAFCPMRIKGLTSLTMHTPTIFAANHASYIDAVVLFSLLPADTRFVGKAELLRVPFLRTFMRRMNMLTVHRTDAAESVQDATLIAEVLREGVSIAIFPEGTFSYAAGLRPFRLGAFKIATEVQVPICPIAIKGTRKILRDDEKLLKPHAIDITISKPIMPQGNDWQAINALRLAVRAEIAKYCGEPSLDFIAAQIVAPKQNE